MQKGQKQGRYDNIRGLSGYSKIMSKKDLKTILHLLPIRNSCRVDLQTFY